LAQANPSRLAHEVAEAYLGALMKAEAPTVQPRKAAAGARAAVPAAELQRLAGAYRNPESGRILRLSVEGGKLVGALGNQKFALDPVAAGRFRIERRSGATSEVEVGGAARGARPRLQIATLDEESETEKETFEPVALWMPTAAALQGFAGNYVSSELDTSWTLVAAEGKLFIRHRGLSEDALEPTVEGEFFLHGMSLTFVRDASGTVTGFTLDEGRVRGIVFRRQAGG
ncbi:MAG TPA: hypothetical protein VGG65_03435, partial [Thermoanaerobaculia bacterium]